MEKRPDLPPLQHALAGLGIEVPSAVSMGLAKYQPLLEKWSRRVRLVGRADAETVAIRHFADALTLLPFLSDLPAGAWLLDIGSGAGFPGLPLALARPDLRLVLVEPDGRKASFLVAAIAHLGLSNVSVKRARAEGDPEGEGLGRAEAVVSRALMDPARWVPLGRAYLSPGGLLLAMMAANAPDEGALRDLGEAHGLALVQRWADTLPGAGQRCIAAWREPEESSA